MERQRESLVRDHLANERTLLAWIRTALTVVGLGFVVDRFAVGEGAERGGPLLGTGLVVLGAVMTVVAAYRFRRADRAIASGAYEASVWPLLVLAAVVVLGALAVMAYLLLS